MGMKDNENKIDRELVLHHLDQVLSSSKDNFRLYNRVYFLLNIFSFMVISLSIGIISINQGISIMGLTLSIPTWLLLLSSAYIVGFLFIYLNIINNFLKLQMEIIRDLYGTAGYKHEFISGGKNSGLFMNINRRVIEDAEYYWEKGRVFRVFYLLFAGMVEIIYFLLPITAEFFAFYKMVELFGWMWWVLLSFLLLLYITIIHLFGAVQPRTAKPPPKMETSRSEPHTLEAKTTDNLSKETV